MPGLKKNERLHNKTIINSLFEKGSSFKSYPFKVYWLAFSEDSLIFNKTQEIRSAVPIDQRKKEKSFDITGKPIPQNAVFSQPAKTMFLVSKKNIRLATKRNRIRRLIKESFRKNKNPFYSFLKKKKLNCVLAITYISKDLKTYKEIESKLNLSLQLLISRIEEENCNYEVVAGK